MFCAKCGNQLPDNAKFCDNCGAPTPLAGGAASAAGAGIDGIVNEVKQGVNEAEKQVESAFNDVKNTFSGSSAPGPDPSGKERLKTDRGLISYIVLSIITCGIYGYYFIYKMAHDINIACEGDGETTGGLAAFILFSFITLGIYSWYWLYKLGNRLANNASRYGLAFQENGTTVLLWCIFGSLICGLGPFFAMNILIKNSNAICAAYNCENGLE